MTARFAGSRSLDERRRRRLASDPNKTESNESIAIDATPDIGLPERSARDAATISRFPLRKLISPKRWKHWSIAGFGLIVGIGILSAGFTMTTSQDDLGPGFSRLFDLTTGRAVSFYISLMLALTGQLSLLIWWVRSKSLQDFAGRYRIWSWAAVASFGFACIVATDAHIAFCETVFWGFDVPFWNREVLCWLAPTAGCVLALLRDLHQEMRDCRSSLSLLWLAVFSWLIACAPMLGLGLTRSDSPGILLHAGASMFGFLCLFSSLLLHTRHVIYETAEPPKKRPSRFGLLLGLIRKRFPNRTANDGWSLDGPVTVEYDVDDATSRHDALPQETGEEVDEPAEPVQHRTTNQSVSTASADNSATLRIDQQEASAESPRIDVPFDKNQLKGLSKKERRKLRKQFREQQRSGQTANDRGD